MLRFFPSASQLFDLLHIFDVGEHVEFGRHAEGDGVLKGVVGKVWVWASISPGNNVAPVPSMTLVSAAVLSCLPMALILLPSTCTSVSSMTFRPSNTLAFRMTKLSADAERVRNHRGKNCGE